MTKKISELTAVTSLADSDSFEVVASGASKSATASQIKTYMSSDFMGAAGTVTDNALLRADGTTGDASQGSVVLVDDTGNMTGLVDVTYSGDLIGMDIKASGSGGVDIKNNAGTSVLILGAGGGTGATFAGAVNANSINTLTTPLSGANGGTGVSNSGKTITVGGNFSMSGAYTFTGTITANTSVTFPTAGTLIKTDVTGITGADAVTNVVSLTSAEYGAIGSPDSATLYIITDA